MISLKTGVILFNIRVEHWTRFDKKKRVFKHMFFILLDEKVKFIGKTKCLRRVRIPVTDSVGWLSKACLLSVVVKLTF